MSERAPGVVPFRFDLSDLVRRSVASLYSHLVTRPTGQAIRLGIESQIEELGDLCLSVLDFTEVVVLDYSCADETVAKLLQRYLAPERPANAYFLARGLGEHHRETLETVLHRHRLALVAQVEGEVEGTVLLGHADAGSRAVWGAVEELRVASIEAVAERVGGAGGGTREILEELARRRVVVPAGGEGPFHALSAFLPPAGRAV